MTKNNILKSLIYGNNRINFYDRLYTETLNCIAVVTEAMQQEEAECEVVQIIKEAPNLIPAPQPPVMVHKNQVKERIHPLPKTFHQ